MSYSRSLEEARAACSTVEPDAAVKKGGSPILKGQDQGGPGGKGELAPKNYTLVGDTKSMKRTL